MSEESVPSDAAPLDPNMQSSEGHATTNAASAQLSASDMRALPYEIEGQLGGGAMTTVYRARELQLDRLVALKVLAQGADDTTRERFRREARTAAMLEHPNIVRTYQVGQMPDSGLSYIAMELVSGPSMASYLEQTSVISARDALLLLEPIARALAYAHARGVVHRDVKPSNILLQPVSADHPLQVRLTSTGDTVAPLLSDFGIARALDAPDLTSAGRTIGTPAFMSPEQCAGEEEIDGRADIYSLGAVLYRCLVGRPPYRGSTTQILHSHVYDPLLFPKEQAQAVPASVLEIIRKSMMKNPGDRYASALEMANDLAQAAVPLAGPLGSSNSAAMVSRYPTSDRTRTPSFVLVPERERRTSSNTSADASSERHAPLTPITSTGTRITNAPQSSARRRSALILGLSLMVVSVLALVALFTVIVPALRSSPATTSATQSASQGEGELDEGDIVLPALPDASTPLPAGVVTEQTSNGMRTTPEPSDGSDDDAMPGDGASRPTPTVQAEVTSSLVVSPEFAWERALTLYEEGEWSESRTWLIAYQRAITDDADAVVEMELVNEMLAESTLWLAIDALEREEYEQAARFAADASETLEDSQLLRQLDQATSLLAEASDAERLSAQEGVQQALRLLASELADSERWCDAAQVLRLASGLTPDEGLDDFLLDAQAACADTRLAEFASEPAGRILYSSNQGDQYSIYQIDLERNAPPRQLIEEASQPSLSPDTTTLAYYSWRSDVQGLVLTDLGQQTGNDAGRVRLTNFVEDSRDSPPSWNPQSDRLAYSSTNFGDGRSRIYLTWADGTRTTTELGLGKDPAWHPFDDLIVFNGTDETGNNPGLWIMRTDGTGRRRLTDNGNDQRPAWSPDGSSIVFMSNGRHSNWEVYRYDIGDGRVTRLTDDVAQDGLPSISPAGDAVAFMSDRDGYWALWYVSIAGGEARPLADITGGMPRWLEHAIQWVP